MVPTYGYQFRRFGCATNGPEYNTIGIEQTAGFYDIFKRYRECAFMGLKVEWHPLLFQLDNQGGTGAGNMKPQITRNNTWFDTIPETIKATTASESLGS